MSYLTATLLALSLLALSNCSDVQGRECRYTPCEVMG